MFEEEYILDDDDDPRAAPIEYKLIDPDGVKHVIVIMPDGEVIASEKFFKAIEKHDIKTDMSAFEQQFDDGGRP